MFKHSVSLLLIGLFLNFVSYTSSARAAVNSLNDKETKFALKIKSGINKLGAGKEVRVKLKMKDGTRLKGYISEINEDSFIVVDSSGKADSVSYSGVKRVTGKNNLNGTKIALGVLIAVAIFAIFVLPAFTDGV